MAKRKIATKKPKQKPTIRVKATAKPRKRNSY
jgi:hypothetical protein